MKNIRKKFIGIFAIGLLFVIFLSNAITLVNDMDTNNNDTILSLKTSSSWTLSEIHINGNATGVEAHNWSWAIEQPWFSIRNDHYVIRNVIINGTHSGIGIEIINPNYKIIIENCTISNVEIGISIRNSLKRTEIINTRIFNIHGINGTDGANGVNRNGYSGSDGQDATGLMIAFSKNINISSLRVSHVYGGNGGNGGDGDDGRAFWHPNAYNGGWGGDGGVANGILIKNSTKITMDDINITDITGGFGGKGGNGGNEGGGSSALSGRGGIGGKGGYGIGFNLCNSTVDMMSNSLITTIHGGNGGRGGNGGVIVGYGRANSGGDGGDGNYGIGFRLERGYITIKNTERKYLYGGMGGQGGYRGGGSGSEDGDDGNDSRGAPTVVHWGGTVYEQENYQPMNYEWIALFVISGIIIGLVIIILTGFIRGGAKVLERRREFNARLKTYRAESSPTRISVQNIPVNQVNRQEKVDMSENRSDLEQALQDINAVLETNPYSSDMWYRKGEILEQLGELEKGLICFQKAIRFKQVNS